MKHEVISAGLTRSERASLRTLANVMDACGIHPAGLDLRYVAPEAREFWAEHILSPRIRAEGKGA